MNIQEMHVGLDLALQRINSNVFNKLLREEKDYFLNVTTQELIRAALLNENNTVFNIISYGDIRKYYETLQYYIRSVELNVNESLGQQFVYGDFPVNIPMGKKISGYLYKHIPYKILVSGGTDLTDAGAPVDATEGTVFVCNPDNITLPENIVGGETYRIINTGGHDLSSVGAASGKPGTVFVATADGEDATPAPTALVLERLTIKPTWLDGTEITPISNYGYFNYLSSRSAVRYGQAIASGTLTRGKKYYVYKTGSTDLSSVGGFVINSVGAIFTCTAETEITWEDGTILYEVLDSVNRIIKFQDVYNFLEHSYGTTVSSPVATLADNKLYVYHNYKFDINRIYLDYIKEPISVSRENSVDSDLPVSMHPFLVSTTAEYIHRTMGVGQQQMPQQEQ